MGPADRFTKDSSLNEPDAPPASIVLTARLADPSRTAVQTSCWLMIGDYTTQIYLVYIYILVTAIIQQRGIPINQPGFNGMTGILNTAQVVEEYKR